MQDNWTSNSSKLWPYCCDLIVVPLSFLRRSLLLLIIYWLTFMFFTSHVAVIFTRYSTASHADYHSFLQPRFLTHTDHIPYATFSSNSVRILQGKMAAGNYINRGVTRPTSRVLLYVEQLPLLHSYVWCIFECVVSLNTDSKFVSHSCIVDK